MAFEKQNKKGKNPEVPLHSHVRFYFSKRSVAARPAQNHVSLDFIMRVIHVENSSTMAPIPNIWIWRRHIETRDVKVCASERGTKRAPTSTFPSVGAPVHHGTLPSFKNAKSNAQPHDPFSWRANFQIAVLRASVSDLNAKQKKKSSMPPFILPDTLLEQRGEPGLDHFVCVECFLWGFWAMAFQWSV